MHDPHGILTRQSPLLPSGLLTPHNGILQASAAGVRVVVADLIARVEVEALLAASVADEV